MSVMTKRIGAFTFAIFTEIIISLMLYFSVDWSFVILAGIQGLIIFEIMNRSQNWLRWITLPIYIAVYIVVRSISGYVFWTVFFHSANFEYPWQFSFAFTDPYSLITASIVVFGLFFLISGRWHNLPLKSNYSG